MVSKTCYYCGDKKLIGVDRIKSNEGYIKENCVPCCSMCNYFKRNYTIEQFLNHVNKIYKYQNKRN